VVTVYPLHYVHIGFPFKFVAICLGFLIAMSQFRVHPLSKILSEEVHARPYGLLLPPVRISHLAVLSGESDPDGDQHHIAELCRHFAAP
jgi:uncharacterized membrane-anchored protein